MTEIDPIEQPPEVEDGEALGDLTLAALVQLANVLTKLSHELCEGLGDLQDRVKYLEQRLSTMPQKRRPSATVADPPP